jgi:multidrug efflux pump subunit AcrA (membrane-fusion protein)
MRFVVQVFVLFFCFTSVMSQELVTLEKTTNKIEIYGYTRAYKSLTISSEVAGKCLKTSGEIGSIVKENETIFTFDDTNTKLLITQIKLGLDIAARQIEFLEKEVVRNEKIIKNK